MKISIITVCLNSEKTILANFNSILSQSYKNIEHLIIDGGSIDNTLEICNSFSHISKIISEFTTLKPSVVNEVLPTTNDLPEPGPPARKIALKIPGSLTPSVIILLQSLL